MKLLLYVLMILCCTAYASAEPSLNLAPTRGSAEILNQQGEWRPLERGVVAEAGTVIRTRPRSEVVGTFDDGSTFTLGESSTMKIADLALARSGSRVTVKVLGQWAASVSPARLSVAMEAPVGRVVVDRQSIEQSIGTVPASNLSAIRGRTATGRRVRVSVVEGAATLQTMYHVAGVLKSADVASGTFTLQDGERETRVVVSRITQLAAATPTEAEVRRSPRQIVGLLENNQKIVVYGSPGASGTVNATLVYPPNGLFVSPLRYMEAPGTPPMGDGVVSTKGSALNLEAGQTTARVESEAPRRRRVGTVVAVLAGLAAIGILLNDNQNTVSPVPSQPIGPTLRARGAITRPAVTAAPSSAPNFGGPDIGFNVPLDDNQSIGLSRIVNIFDAAGISHRQSTPTVQMNYTVRF